MKKTMFNDSNILELSSSIMQNVSDAELRLDALKNEFTTRAAVLQEEVKARHGELWAQIYDATGIDPNGDYTIDTSYIEDCGVVFIMDKPKEREMGGSLSEMLKQAMADGRVEMVSGDTDGHISLGDILADALEN